MLKITKKNISMYHALYTYVDYNTVAYKTANQKFHQVSFLLHKYIKYYKFATA